MNHPVTRLSLLGLVALLALLGPTAADEQKAPQDDKDLDTSKFDSKFHELPPQLQGMLWLNRPRKKETAADTKAKEVVKQFLDGIAARNAKEALKHADVPWLGEGEKVETDRKALQKTLQQMIDRASKRKTEWETSTVLPYHEARKKNTGEQTQKLLDKVLGKDDRLVFVTSKQPMAARYVLVKFKEETPKVVGGPYPLPYLLMNNKLPASVRAALEKPEQFVVYSLDPDSSKKRKDKKKQKDDKEMFHGWSVLGKTVVKEAETQNQLRAALQRGFDETFPIPASCFDPRHGIRVTAGKKTFDLVICFECFRVEVYEGEDEMNQLLISGSVQPTFDKLLRDSGVSLPK